MVHSDAKHESRAVACGTVVAFLCGIAIIVVAVWAGNSDSLELADRLVRFNSKGAIMTLKVVAEGTLLLGVLVIIFGILGMAGVFMGERAHKPLISAYALSLLFIGIIYLSITILAFVRHEAVGPIIKRQVQDFCNTTTYARLITNLECPAGSLATTPLVQRRLYTADCNVECQERVDLWKQWDGCDLLPRLCSRFKYGDIGEGYCVVGDVPQKPPMYATTGEADACRKACDKDIKCPGYVAFYNGDTGTSCNVISTNPAKYLAPTWTTVQAAATVQEPLVLSATDGTPGSTCTRKLHSMAFQRFDEYSTKLGWICFVFTVILLTVSTLTFCHLYTVSMRRKGKAGGGKLCCLMNCPCCHPEGKDHMNENESDEPLDSENGEAAE